MSRWLKPKLLHLWGISASMVRRGTCPSLTSHYQSVPTLQPLPHTGVGKRARILKNFPRIKLPICLSLPPHTHTQTFTSSLYPWSSLAVMLSGLSIRHLHYAWLGAALSKLRINSHWGLRYLYLSAEVAKDCEWFTMHLRGYSVRTPRRKRNVCVDVHVTLTYHRRLPSAAAKTQRCNTLYTEWGDDYWHINKSNRRTYTSTKARQSFLPGKPA